MRKLMLCGAAALLSVAIGGCDKEQDREPAKEKKAEAKEKKADSKGADREAKGDAKKTERAKGDEALPSRR